MLENRFGQANAVAVAGNGNAFASASSRSGSASAVAVAGNGYAYASASSGYAGGCGTPAAVSVPCRSFKHVPCQTRAQGVSLACAQQKQSPCSRKTSPCGNQALYMARNPQVAQRNMTLVIIQRGCQQMDNAGNGNANAAGGQQDDFSPLISALMGKSDAEGAQKPGCSTCSGGSNPSGGTSSNPTGGTTGSGDADIPSQFANLPKPILEAAKAFAKSAASGSKDAQGKTGEQSSQYKELFKQALMMYLFLQMAQSFLNQGNKATETEKQPTV